MLVYRKKPFAIGIALIVSFAALFYILLAPIFPVDNEKLTGLQYADQVFNELSKGSSYFIPLAQATADTMKGKKVQLAPKIDNGANVDIQELILTKGDAKEISYENGRLSFSGDLGNLLSNAVEAAKLLYNNNGNRLEQIYEGAKPLAIAQGWWHLLNPCVKELEKQGLFAEARAVETILRRAIEPGNNFYGIEAKNVSDNIPLIVGFLLFYVIYTVWYGFAVYEIFVGFGLMNTEARKEEILADSQD